MNARELLALVQYMYPNATGTPRGPYPPIALRDYVRQECAHRYGDSQFHEVLDELEHDAEREEEDDDGHRGVGA